MYYNHDIIQLQISYESLKGKTNMLKLKTIHQDSVLQKAMNLKTSINYYNETISPQLINMDDWKANEFIKVYEQDNKKLKELIKYINENESTFNNILNQYIITCTIFILKYL